MVGLAGGTLGLLIRVAATLLPLSLPSVNLLPINRRSDESSSTPRPNQRPHGKLRRYDT